MAKELMRYDRMRTAIAECHSIDDCKEIASQAAGLAEYYRQIKDDESVAKFLQIKIRAWRRIGEILTGVGVDKSKCESTAEYIRQIRTKFKGRKEVKDISDAMFRQALKILEVPVDFFEQNVVDYQSIDTLVGAFTRFKREEWEATPEGQAELAKREEQAKTYAKKQKEQVHDALQHQARLQALEEASDEAFREVGITLDRRDREKMMQVVFLLKRSIHDILRQAAFDNRMTMQSVLRAGLMMWFIAHGYAIPANDLPLPRRGDRTARPGKQN